MVLIDHWFMSEGTALIGVVVLQHGVELVNGEVGLSGGTGVTSTVGGNEVVGVEAERVAGITEVENQEPSIPVMTEYDVSCVAVSSVCALHVGYVESWLSV
jgi:hypothetical protein